MKQGKGSLTKRALSRLPFLYILSGVLRGHMKKKIVFENKNGITFTIEYLEYGSKTSRKIQLYWELLRRNEKYIQDYRRNIAKSSLKKKVQFCKKWKLSKPLNPQEEYNPGILDNTVNLPGFIDDAILEIECSKDGILRLAIDLSYSTTRLVKAVKKQAEKYKEGFKEICLEPKGVFQVLFPHFKNDWSYYAGLLLVHDLQGKKYSYDKIIEEAQKRGIAINSRANVRDYLKRYRELQELLISKMRDK
jgi:hypothetical protein